jgi:hypothetical protein
VADIVLAVARLVVALDHDARLRRERDRLE